jgi:hypothetical protein
MSGCERRAQRAPRWLACSTADKSCPKVSSDQSRVERLAAKSHSLRRKNAESDMLDGFLVVCKVFCLWEQSRSRVVTTCERVAVAKVISCSITVSYIDYAMYLGSDAIALRIGRRFRTTGITIKREGR